MSAVSNPCEAASRVPAERLNPTPRPSELPARSLEPPPNVEIRPGYLEELPVESDSVDLVISNGVLNLSPDKPAVLREAFRVLKPGGRLHLSDIIVSVEVPGDARSDVSLWTGCIAGALMDNETRGLLTDASFTGITFSNRRYDSFEGAPQASSAAEFGTVGVDIRATKPSK